MKMMTSPLHRNSRELSRRRFLRGAGVVMALPWLESVPSGAPTPTARAAPKRLAVLFMGNGVNPDHWWAKGSGAEMELGTQPCADGAAQRPSSTSSTGCSTRAATGVGIHPGQTGNILSGAPLQKGAELHGGVSMDQVLASHFGDETVQPSMVLGLRAADHRLSRDELLDGLQLAHLLAERRRRRCRWRSIPSLAFDSLFDNRGSRRNQSILDRVQGAGRGAEPTGQRRATRAKLDEYLTQRPRGREAGRRTCARRRRRPTPSAIDSGRPPSAMKRPDNGLPEDIREHMRLMCDIVALGFQTDKTRVATLLLCRDISGLFYPFLDVELAHHLGLARRPVRRLRADLAFYVSQFAYLADKLDAMPEGEGTVLDNSCLMFMSNMWSGSKHDNSKLPVLLAGGLGGTLQTGRVLDYADKGDDNRKLCSLYLSLMDRMGVKLDRFGDATERLTGI